MALLASSIFFGLMLGAWWLDRIVFTPNDTAATAVAILGDPTIRTTLIGVIAGFAAPAVGITGGEMRSFLENEILTNAAGAGEFAGPMGQIHRLVIGQTTDPVAVTGADLVTIVRDQRVSDITDFRLPIQTVGTLQTIDLLVSWMVPICGGLGLVCLLAGIFFRPERGEGIRALAEFMIATGTSVFVFGYLLPVYLLPAIDNRTWIAIAPRLAIANVEVTLGITVIGVVGGLALLLYRRGSGPRKQWSTTLSSTRYRSGPDAGWSR